ncbi:hypothetical protein PPL_01635 [Heterostelium album PN500]|uniref:Uncharacterized protein n=1 Tax=Heterostelium pallidum (strain ATCC 26659 / Pp 5 / PN500) TaxID=670386 RepID=D3B021_HETP5|nr:hypothetical protein PPL_01635 [Heterostelium album PN500]EFA84645.1 hypothetical protein PPL_01635 [Heterostelium album PN500]|eukprot:XP_020436758.1 hypothetical protein PPL_01635 [Heterostelium album PN500]
MSNLTNQGADDLTDYDLLLYFRNKWNDWKFSAKIDCLKVKDATVVLGSVSLPEFGTYLESQYPASILVSEEK